MLLSSSSIAAAWATVRLAAGEWQEAGNGGVFHIRRRLTAAECELGGGLVMRDIRGTLEEQARLRALMAAVSPEQRAVLVRLIGQQKAPR